MPPPIPRWYRLRRQRFSPHGGPVGCLMLALTVLVELTRAKVIWKYRIGSILAPIIMGKIVTYVLIAVMILRNNYWSIPFRLIGQDQFLQVGARIESASFCWY